MFSLFTVWAIFFAVFFVANASVFLIGVIAYFKDKDEWGNWFNASGLMFVVWSVLVFVVLALASSSP